MSANLTNHFSSFKGDFRLVRSKNSNFVVVTFFESMNYRKWIPERILLKKCRFQSYKVLKMTRLKTSTLNAFFSKLFYSKLWPRLQEKYLVNQAYEILAVKFRAVWTFYPLKRAVWTFRPILTPRHNWLHAALRTSMQCHFFRPFGHNSTLCN